MTLLLLLVFVLASAVSAHSWIECLDTDRTVVFDHAASYIYGGQHAAGLCQGYQRNYRGRGEHIHDEDLMVKILKDDYSKPNTLVCKPGASSPPTADGFHKRLRVTAGTSVFYAYMPNGHVAVDKAARGTLYGLYWSAQPAVDLRFTTDLTDATLLDGRRHDFDDGVCGQTYANRTTHELSGRAGDAFPCVGEFTIPAETRPGVYQMVWMWKFWDEQNDQREIVTVGGKYGGAAYSSCFDVEVTAAGEDVYQPGTVIPAEGGADTEAESENDTQAPSWTRFRE